MSTGGGEPTGPCGVGRVDLLKHVDGATTVGRGEYGCGVYVVFFAYAVTCLLIRSKF